MERNPSTSSTKPSSSLSPAESDSISLRNSTILGSALEIPAFVPTVLTTVSIMSFTE